MYIRDIESCSVGDIVFGRVLWGDGTIIECKVLKKDAGISRDALVVETKEKNTAIMLYQSVEYIKE
jgi:hypothetical protein